MNPLSANPSSSSQIDPGLACYLINMDRSKDRLAKTGARLEELHFAFERISAVDGSQMPDDEYARLTQENRFYRTLSAGEVGCYMSHVASLQRLLASSMTYALILEDDVILPDNLHDIVVAAIRLRESGSAGAIGEWHVLKLQGQRNLHVRIADMLPGYELVEYGLSVPTCAGASIWHREGARRFLDHFKGATRPVDCEFQHPWEYGLQIRSVHPTLVWTEGASTIGKRKKGQSNALLKMRYEARRIIPKLVHFVSTYGVMNLLRRVFKTRKAA